ncbi:NAD(P)-dependent oxidoreductase [Shimazuella alba]|uniref:NAD(P)-binding domain-containing protein n=1 Tax=Shimazuella alba TaxID=2690964 RepID=A0A6I4VPY2_9BACL|nr:NAD(P)-binding domain-containing protein [Shimazuella alba]MXQ52458.1 NAD(P)-binding domain-containing protein [Shimazuella alba]
MTQIQNNKTPVTILGLGPMGQALAQSFLKNGHPTTVWNRTAKKAKDLVKQGANQANTVADAILASPLVVICVLDYNIVHSILHPVSSELKGRTLVNLTADTPSSARETAAWAIEQKFEYLDGAIMTPVPTIGNSDALVLYSGKEEIYHTHRSTLASIGGTSTYLGTDPGRAAAYDVSLLDLFWTSMSGFIHALAVAKSENIAAKDILSYTKGIIGILPDIMTDMADEVDTGHYPGELSNITSAAAGMKHIIHAAKAHHLDVSVLSAAKHIAQKAIDKGHGKDGFSRLIEELSQSE